MEGPALRQCKAGKEYQQRSDHHPRLRQYTAYFLQNAGQLLSKEQITVRIWGYDTDVSYNNEEVYISFLRKKLAWLQAEEKIETVRGSGYRLKVGA